MVSWGSYSSLYGPVMAFLGIGLLIILLRWAFGGGSSVVERPSQPGTPQEYGLLNSVAAPATYVEAEIVRQQLAAGQVRATVAMTNDGPRVMVWPDDEARARQVLTNR
jgi:hypothetical protein